MLNKFLEFTNEKTKNLKGSKITKSKIKNLTKDLTKKFTITLAGDRVFKTTSEFEKLLNQIVDYVMKLDPLVIKLQSKFMLDQDTAT